MSNKLTFIGALVIALMSSWWAFQVFQDYRALRSHPGRAKGTVVKKNEHTDQQSHRTNYSVSYSFEVEGKAYEERISVRLSDYVNFTEGGPASVLFVPEDPTRSCLVGYEPSKTKLKFLVAFASVWLLVAGFGGRRAYLEA